MYLMYEDLARAHTEARLCRAREQRRSVYLSRAQRLARRAERVDEQTRLVLSRSV